MSAQDYIGDMDAAIKEGIRLGRREVFSQIASIPLRLTSVMSCPYCNLSGLWHREDSPANFALKINHAPDCLWVIAQNESAQP